MSTRTFKDVVSKQKLDILISSLIALSLRSTYGSVEARVLDRDGRKFHSWGTVVVLVRYRMRDGSYLDR